MMKGDKLIFGEGYRRLCYEFFVYSHVVAGVAYLGFMFWHCEDLLTSVRIHDPTPRNKG